MQTKSHVFINIGDSRKVVDAYVNSQGLCLSDVPALRAAAKRFCNLTPKEAALPAEQRDRIHKDRQAECLRVLQAIEALRPSLRLRRTLTDVVNAALEMYLPTLPPGPDVTTTFQDLLPSDNALAR
jgi:hypothetical protein